MNLQQAREKLGVESLSVSQFEDFCSVYLHFRDRSICIGTGNDFREAVKSALQDRKRQAAKIEEA